MKSRSLLILAALPEILGMDSSITIEAKGTVAEIRISGPISAWNNSAATFRQKIDDLIAKGVKDVNLYINTPGGSVFEANEMANDIKAFPGKIKGYGGALVASAGSYLALICESFEMAENGQYMYHKPSGYIAGNEDQVASDLKLLQNLTKQYKKAYADKTGMSEQDIETNWSKGDVWLSAQEALDQGFITAVSKPAIITKESQAVFAACGAPVIPTINAQIEEQENNMKNRNQIIATLKLSADATDEQIEAAIKASMEKSDRVDSAEKNLKDTEQKTIEAYVDGVILAKKAKADEKPDLIALATGNFEAFKRSYDAKPVLEKLSTQLDPEAQAAAADKGREKWTLQDYIDKDVVALEKLIAEEPAKYQTLAEAHYGK